MKHALRYAFVAMIALSPLAAKAALMAINFTIASTGGGTITGSGTAFTDSSHLDANDFTINPNDLTAMSLSVSGIPGVPSTSVFSKADLNEIEWILAVDGGGTISDLNFFMRNGGPNADGYSIEGISPFNSLFCQGGAGNNSCLGGANAVLDQLVITITNVTSAAVPEPLTATLVALGLAGVGFSRRRRA